MIKTAFLYSEKFSTVSYGSDHPMRPLRLKLAFELIKEKKLFVLENSGIIEARQAALEELLTFHTAEYLKALKESDSGAPLENGSVFGLGFGDNPCFKGVFEWSSFVTGASVQAAELVASGKKDIAFNIGGGLHHAMRAKASGFCYINDPVVAINFLLRQGKRVAYIDIDAHHGDGVQAAFYDTDKVIAISLHENGEFLFPGTGFPEDFGTGQGRGYSINLPFLPETGDELFTWGFEQIVPSFIEAYKPDIIVTQLGVDTFATDPITHLRLTTNGFETMIKRFRSFNLPWVALGGGGYDLDNVKRAWTLAWAIMNKVEDRKNLIDLRDAPLKEKPSDAQRKSVEEAVRYLKKEVLPLVRKGKA